MPKHKTDITRAVELALQLTDQRPKLGRLTITLGGKAMTSLSVEEREKLVDQGVQLSPRDRPEIEMRLHAHLVLLTMRHPTNQTPLPTGTYDMVMVSPHSNADWQCTVFNAAGVQVATCTVDC